MAFTEVIELGSVLFIGDRMSEDGKIGYGPCILVDGIRHSLWGSNEEWIALSRFAESQVLYSNDEKRETNCCGCQSCGHD